MKAANWIPLGAVLLLGSGSAWAESKTKSAPVQVLFAARDLEAGALLTPADVELRSVDAQWVTSSDIKQDDQKYVMNQRLDFPVKKGDMLLWTLFETQSGSSKLWEACEHATGGHRSGAELISIAREKIRRRAHR